MKFVKNTIKSCLFRFCFSVFLVTLFPGGALCQTKTIIGFGDSLTEGCDVQEAGSCGWVGGTGYEGALESLLTQNGYDFTVNNFGRGGETSTEGVNRIDSVLDDPCNQGADYILLFEGTNDLLHGVGGMTVKFNLGVMIDKSRAKGVEPLLATITPDPDHEYKDIPLMNTWIGELAVEKDVVLVDLYEALNPHWDTYTTPRACYGDLTHPNSTGFDAMGSVWYASLSDMPVMTENCEAYSSSAIVYGSVAGTSGLISGLFFQYGEDCEMDKSVPAVPGTVDDFVMVEAKIYDLKPETTYCYRLVSTENGELIHNGATYSFTALPPPLPWLMLLLGTP